MFNRYFEWINTNVISDFTIPSESQDYLYFTLEIESGRSQVIYSRLPSYYSTGQSQISSPGLLVHLFPSTSICFSCHLQFFCIWFSPVLHVSIVAYCCAKQSLIEYYICRKDNLCASGSTYCKFGEFSVNRRLEQVTQMKEHNQVNTPEYQTLSKMCTDKYLQKPFYGFGLCFWQKIFYGPLKRVSSHPFFFFLLFGKPLNYGSC